MVEVERTIRTVKESGREIVNTLTYYYLPSYININLIYVIVMWLISLKEGKKDTSEVLYKVNSNMKKSGLQKTLKICIWVVCGVS